jgi:hypothetical protein
LFPPFEIEKSKEEVVTVTVADWVADPPVPLQVSEKVVFPVRLPVLCEPETALVPDHPPDALHEVELVEFQVSVEAPPEATEAGLAEMSTVGACVGGGALVPAACLYRYTVHFPTKQETYIITP